MPDLEIQNAFLDGINEVFSIMFTENVKMFFLDKDATKTNVYGESKSLVFKDPVSIVAKVVFNTAYQSGSEGSPQFREDLTSVITVPAKQFILNNIPYSSKEDLEVLRTCEFEYSGVRFEVLTVNLKVLVADAWQMCEFSCRKKYEVLNGS